MIRWATVTRYFYAKTVNEAVSMMVTRCCQPVNGILCESDSKIEIVSWMNKTFDEAKKIAIGNGAKSIYRCTPWVEILLKKQMTIAEIERELGYGVEIRT